MSLPVGLLEQRVQHLQQAVETGAAQLQKMQANFNALQGALQEAQHMLATAKAATEQAPEAPAAAAAPQAVVPQAAVPSEEPASPAPAATAE